MRRSMMSVVCPVALALVGLAGQALGAGAAVRVESPLRAAGAHPDVAGGAMQLALDGAAYRNLAKVDRAVFAGFSLGGAQQRSVDLELSQFDVYASDAQIINVTDRGDEVMAKPDMQFWHGTIAGEPESRVFLAITPTGANGFVSSGHQTWVVSNGPAMEQPTVVFEQNDEVGRGVNILPVACGGGIIAPGSGAQLPERPNVGEEQGGQRAFTCRQYRIAIDGDNEFTQRFGNATAAQAYIATLVGAASEIYARDMNVSLKLVFARSWTATDPYTATDNGNQLPQFATYWGNNMGAVQRDLAHLLSTRGLGGGIAYLYGLCNSSGYAVSANLNGFFPYPIQDHNGQNWDLNVYAHETGHNLGTGHTHEINWYNPIIDGCGLAYVGGTQDCSQAFQGTIMSYCHICPGGETNLNMTFGTRVSQTIRSYLDGSGAFCGSTLPTVAAQPVGTTVNEGDPVSITASFNTIGTASYQWRKGGSNLTNGGRFSGVNTPTLSISPTQPGDAGNYDLVLSGNCGGSTTNTAAVLVNITCPAGNDRPNINDQPDNATVTQGSPASFTVSATGAGTLTYQWRRGLVNVVNGGTVSGANLPTLSISATEFSDAGAYNCVVTGPQCSSTSAQATLAVTPPPPGGFSLLSPAPGATGVALNVTLDWSNSTAANTYEVTLDNNSDFSSPIVQLQTGVSQLTLTPGTIASSTVYYWKVVATNDIGTTPSSPASASFTTLVPPPVCHGDFNGDHKVDTGDLATLLGFYGATVPIFTNGDCTGDGLVNTADLTTLLSEFGRTNCP